MYVNKIINIYYLPNSQPGYCSWYRRHIRARLFTYQTDYILNT